MTEPDRDRIRGLTRAERKTLPMDTPMDASMDAPANTAIDAKAEGASLLTVQSCRQSYHKDASADLVVLDDVNLELHEGEIVALLGRSGSG